MNIERYKWPVIITASLHGSLFLYSPATPGIAVPAPTEKRVWIKPTVDPLPMEPDPADAPENNPAAGGARALTATPEPPALPTQNPAFTVSVSPDVPVLDPIKDLRDFRGGPIGPGVGVGDLRGVSIPDVGRLDRVPRAMVQPAPAYPDLMRREGIDGSVTVSFVVDLDGRVLKAEVVSSSHREFEEPALRAVLRWRFEPGTQGGRKVSFRMAVPIEFKAGG